MWCCVSEEIFSVKITLCSDRIKVDQSSSAVQSKLPRNETEKNEVRETSKSCWKRGSEGLIVEI